MTNEEFFKQIEPVIGKAEADGDCYLIVHFSLSQDDAQKREYAAVAKKLCELRGEPVKGEA